MIKHIYYINLEKDVGRRDQMEAQLKAIYPSTPFSRFPALDRIYVKENQDVISKRVEGTYLQLNSGDFPRPGAIGCYLSHEKIIEELQDPVNSSSDDIFMVLEDDCRISPSFPSYFSQMVSHLNKIDFQWTVLKPVCRKSVESHKVNDFLYKTSLSKELDHSYYFGTHMLFYNAKTINKLLLDLRSRKIKDIDYVLNKEIEGVFAFKLQWPEMVWQDNLGGSNTTDNQPWSAIK